MQHRHQAIAIDHLVFFNQPPHRAPHFLVYLLSALIVGIHRLLLFSWKVDGGSPLLLTLAAMRLYANA
ncbi:hypothetical protein [Serratia marcescens]|uniref:hypothetical protein n=1 Tax=Serratia marcescens TaxID=615 RepID=UPI00275FF564|nr:hypothetical protein [Serratia marcescens]MDP8764526.1 hypothetical protein [Serratia marcescens]